MHGVNKDKVNEQLPGKGAWRSKGGVCPFLSARNRTLETRCEKIGEVYIRS